MAAQMPRAPSIHSASCPLTSWQRPSGKRYLRRGTVPSRSRTVRSEAAHRHLAGQQWKSTPLDTEVCKAVRGRRGRSRLICRARRKRNSSQDSDDEQDQEFAASSRGSNDLEDNEDGIVEDGNEEDVDEEEGDEEDVEAGISAEAGADDDDEDDEDEMEEEEDTADAGVHDPTTRLFQMVKDRDYDEEEEDVQDDEEDGLMPLSEEPDPMKRRGRKRKTIYGRANEDNELLSDDEGVGESGAESGQEDEFQGDNLEDLDAVMGDTFTGEEAGQPMEQEAEAMPSRAEQWRPEDSTMDEGDDGQAGANYEDSDEDGLGPLPQYNEIPQRSYTLGDLMEMCNYKVPEAGVRDLEVTGIQDLAHMVQEGDLYVCTEELGYDGYLFLEEAVDRGAVAVVSEYDIDGLDDVPIVMVPRTKEALRRFSASFYNHPSRKMLMVGVAGSKGKTTTSWLVRGIFEEMQLVTGMVGSLEYSLAVDKMTGNGDLWQPEEEDITLQRDCSTAFYMTPYRGKYEQPPTTPSMLQSQKVLAGMADRGATACVYEMGLFALQSGWTRSVDLDVAIFMGLSPEDIKAAGGSKPLLEALWPMFSALKDPKRQTAVVNLDDPFCEEILRFAQNVPSVTFSVSNKEADVYVDKVIYSLWETEVVIATPAGKLNLSSTLIGPLNLPNILAAVAAGLALTVDGDGIPLKAIVQGIEATEIVPGRCEVIDEEQNFGVVVDSANDPKSLSLLLDSIRKIEPRRIILVTGCEGERDRDDRPLIGEIAHYKADLVILTNNNPRGEDPRTIVADTVAGYPDELLAYNASQAYPTGFLHDPGRIPIEALEFSWQNCFEFRRYVMEDRWTAIRWAIGTAQKNDCVVVAGKGSEDFQEWDIGFGLVKSWFDDRVECRNALSRVKPLNEHSKDIARRDLPWMEPDERADNPRLFDLNTDNLALLSTKHIPKEWLEESKDLVKAETRQR